MNDQARYVATTKLENIPLGYQVFMVDGCVPGWEPSNFDYCWNHHRQGGAMTQVDEMPFPDDEVSLLDKYSLAVDSNTENINRETSSKVPQVIVTTQIDADACCSAAWLQLSGQVLRSTSSDNPISSAEKLRAIAYDCDHLYVPDSLSSLEDFAAQAVATIKQQSFQRARDIGLPEDRKLWTDAQSLEHASFSFQLGTQWLIDAALGKCPWPGASGEAVDYWEKIEADKEMLYKSDRINVLNHVAVCDMRGIGRFVDVRSFVRAVRKYILPYNDLRVETLIIRDHGVTGHRYTLSSIPGHPKYLELDYTAGTLERLSEAEKRKSNGLDIDYKWGGRQQVAGSAWNSPSHLEPEEVVALL